MVLHTPERGWFIRGNRGGNQENRQRKKELQGEYREIDPELLPVAYGNAWSIESMAAHGAGDRGVEYIGSSTNGYLDNDKRNGKTIFDYYRDTAGAYWFKNRALLPSGEIVSMERYIFGREIKKEKYTKQYRKNR